MPASLAEDSPRHDAAQPFLVGDSAVVEDDVVEPQLTGERTLAEPSNTLVDRVGVPFTEAMTISYLVQTPATAHRVNAGSARVLLFSAP